MFEVTDEQVELLKNRIGGYQCSECKGILSIAWGGSFGINGHVVRCPKGVGCLPSIENVARPAHLSPMKEQGFNLFNLNKKRRKEVEQTFGEKAKALAKYHGIPVVSRDVAREIITTIYKDAPAIEQNKAILLCASYNLNPLMRHVFLLPFAKQGSTTKTWALVIGIDATRLMAHRKHNFTYLDLTPRVATKEETEKILGENADPNRIYFITKIKDLDTNAEVYGIGTWLKKDTAYGADKGNTPSNMASVRSERQAINRLYPSEMPAGDIEVMDERFIDADYTVTEEPPEDEQEKPPELGDTELPPVEPQDAGEAGAEKAEESEDRLVTKDEIATLQDQLREHGKDMMWLGNVISNVKGWNVRDLKALTQKQLVEIYEELNK